MFNSIIIGKKSMIVHVPVTDTGSGVTEISYTMTPRDAVGNLDSGSAETKTATVTNGEAKITFDKDFRGTITIICTDKAGNAADISMFIKIGSGDWNAITATKEPIEVVIDIPEKLLSDGREYYIIRAHNGEYTFMDDLDDAPDSGAK